MASNYAEICRVGNLEADFQQVPLVQFFFLKFSQYCHETSIPAIQIQHRKVKNIFLKKKNIYIYIFLDKKLKKKKSLSVISFIFPLSVQVEFSNTGIHQSILNHGNLLCVLQ